MSNPNPPIPADLADRWCWFGRALRLIGGKPMIALDVEPDRLFALAREHDRAAERIAEQAAQLRAKAKPGRSARRPTSAIEAASQLELDL